MMQSSIPGKIYLSNLKYKKKHSRASLRAIKTINPFRVIELNVSKKRLDLLEILSLYQNYCHTIEIFNVFFFFFKFYNVFAIVNSLLYFAMTQIVCREELKKKIFKFFSFTRFVVKGFDIEYAAPLGLRQAHGLRIIF